MVFFLNTASGPAQTTPTAVIPFGARQRAKYSFGNRQWRPLLTRLAAAAFISETPPASLHDYNRILDRLDLADAWMQV
jgi:hypothetical protein